MSFIVALLANLFIGAVDKIKIAKTASDNKQRYEQNEKRDKIKQIQTERDKRIAEINARYNEQNRKLEEQYNRYCK